MPPLSFNNNALAHFFEVRQGLNDLLNERDNLNLHVTKLEAEMKILFDDSRILQDDIRILTKPPHSQPSTTRAATISRGVRKNKASGHQLRKRKAQLAMTEDRMAEYRECIKILRERGE